MNGERRRRKVLPCRSAGKMLTVLQGRFGNWDRNENSELNLGPRAA